MTEFKVGLGVKIMDANTKLLIIIISSSIPLSFAVFSIVTSFGLRQDKEKRDIFLGVVMRILIRLYTTIAFLGFIGITIFYLINN